VHRLDLRMEHRLPATSGVSARRAAMRWAVLCTLALWGGPAAAGPLSACDFITQAEVETMLGGPVGPPAVTYLNICAGLCEGLNATRCDFETIARPDAKPKQLYLTVFLPPFEPGNWPSILHHVWTPGQIEGAQETLEDLTGFSGPAVWYFRAEIGQGSLAVYPSRRIHLHVDQFNVMDRNAALANARAAATLALKRFAALKKSRLKNAFERGRPDETHPWHL
jgi:hypothetical protein